MKMNMREIAKDVKTTEEKAVHLEHVSTATLLKNYGAIEAARKADEATPSEQGKEYGVRKHFDLKAQALKIEGILETRGVKYEKIQW